MKAVILRQIRANYHKVIQSIPEIPTTLGDTNYENSTNYCYKVFNLIDCCWDYCDISTFQLYLFKCMLFSVHIFIYL